MSFETGLVGAAPTVRVVRVLLPLLVGRLGVGRLGHGSQRSFAPERVPFPGDDRTVIVGAAAGYAHSLFVDATGRAFACGSNARGALGLGDHVDSAYRPARTPPPGSRAARALGAVARVAAGGASSAFRAAAGTKRTAKAVVLHQGTGALGCGNIIANEGFHLARVDPAAEAASLGRAEADRLAYWLRAYAMRWYRDGNALQRYRLVDNRRPADGCGA